MKRELYLSAEYEESEGLDGEWDVEDLSPEASIIFGYFDGTNNISRDEAVEATVTLLGSKLDDADLTSL